MSCRLASFRCGRLLAVWVLGGAWACLGQGPARTRGRAIEFAEPRSGELTNGLRQLTSKKDGLKLWEEDLHNPLRSLNPDDSIVDSLAVPLPAPRGPAKPTRRAQEEEERRKNWAFMKPEDLMSAPTVEQLLQSPQYEKDGREKQSLSLVEQFFLGDSSRGDKAKGRGKSQERNRFGNGSSQDASVAESDGDSGNSELPAGLDDSEKSLKKTIDSKSGASVFDRPNGTFADIFGLGHRELTPEELLAHKERMEEFRQILDPDSRLAGAKDSLNSSLMDSLSRSANVPIGLSGLPNSSVPDRSASASSGFNSLATGLPDLSASLNAPAPPSFTPVLPKVELPSVTPPTPNFIAPRRQF
jgi:hypothetical protein